MREPGVDISSLVKSRTAFYLDKRQVASELLLVPNLISILRILLLFPIWYYYTDPTPQGHWMALGFLVLSYLSDYADGVVARRFNQQSSLGLILDPLADKIWTLTMLVLLVAHRGLSVWLAATFVLRDLVILYMNGKILRRVGVVMSSDLLGKIYMITLGLMVIGLTIRLPGTLWLNIPLLILAVATLVSYQKRCNLALRLALAAPPSITT